MSDDPAARVDALVTAIGPRLDAPAINRRDVVLVTGPWMAGVSAVVAALRERLPQHKFVESTELGPGDAPTAVVFVVSAAAQLTGSDCALLDAAVRKCFNSEPPIPMKIDVTATMPSDWRSCSTWAKRRRCMCRRSRSGPGGSWSIIGARSSPSGRGPRTPFARCCAAPAARC